jgi:two-component system sensor histidine kinase UhpB
MDSPKLAAASRVGLEEIPFQGIVEAALAGVYVVYDERFCYVNDTFAAMFGYSVDELEGMHMRDLVTLDSGDDVMEKYRQRISGERPSIRYTTKCRHKDGHTVHLEIHGSRVLFRGRPALSGMVVDITERVERQHELARSREQLRELAQNINISREEQRAAFARDVHDVLGGMLSSIKMDVTRIRRRVTTADLNEVQAICTDLLTLTQETIDAARRIADEARPRILDSLGLTAAVEEMLLKFRERSGIEAAMDVQGVMPFLGSERAMHCYRIVQESLTNVARHANARKVHVTVVGSPGGIELHVADDGQGLSTEPPAHAGLGLIGMRERALTIGGSLAFTSNATGGTTVSLSVLVNKPEQDA